MKYVIRRHSFDLGGLLFSVYEKKTNNFLYRVEGFLGYGTSSSELYVYSADGNSHGKIYESGRAVYRDAPVFHSSAYDYAYSVSLGDFHAILQGSAAFLGGRYEAIGTPYHADSFFTLIYGICEGKRDIASLRPSFGDYVVNIKDEKVPRDTVFAIVFGLIALEQKHSCTRAGHR